MSHLIGIGRLVSALPPHARLGALAAVSIIAAGAPAPGAAQSAPPPSTTQATPLPPVTVNAPRRQRAARRGAPSTAPAPADQGTPAPATGTAQPGGDKTPLNSGTVANVASRLGLTPMQTPATV